MADSTPQITAAVVNVIKVILELKKKQRRRTWTRPWISRRNTLGAGEALIRELQFEDTKAFCNFLRMDEEMFDELLKLVKPRIEKQDTVMRSAIPATLKLQIVLRYLASGDTITSLQYLYRVPKNTISSFLVDVLDAIYTSLKEYIKAPNKASDWNSIINGFNNTWNFPACIGAIDGKHVIIKCPKESGSLYFNYKNQFSIVLLALVDHDYNFTCIDVGSYGSCSDGGIFAKSALKTAVEENLLNIPEGSVILGDDAFPLNDYLMKPFPRKLNQDLKERVYNYRHCRARRISENAFGILTNRFRIFSRPIDLQPEKVTKLVTAACALHNWIRRRSRCNHGLTADVDDVEHCNVIPGSWRQGASSGGLQSMAATHARNFPNSARQKRASLADFFMNEGEVSWQYRMLTTVG